MRIMRRLLLLFALGSILLGSGLPSAEAGGRGHHHHPDRGLTVLSFNIHHGADAAGVVDLEKIAAEIEASGADVVGLQEVDRFWGRSGLVDQPRWLAERLGWHVAFGANLQLAPEAGQTRTREYGNAVLSRYPILQSRNRLLTSIDYTERPTEQRGLLQTWIATPTGVVAFASTHLDHQREEQRELAASEIIRWSKHLPKRQILVGDLNAEPGSPAVDALTARWTDGQAVAGDGSGYTYPVEGPTKRIDFVLAAGLRFRSVEVIASDASDHLPVKAVLGR